MLTLAITTSTNHGSICLHDGKTIVASEEWSRAESHAEILAPTLSSCLHKIKAKTSDIKLVACDIGPGSFTGVRIGVSTAKTIAYANKIPVAALTSLEIMASAVKEETNILTILNAQRQEVYAATYECRQSGLTEMQSPQLMSLERLENLLTSAYLVLGDGYDLLKNDFSATAIKNATRSSLYADVPRAENLLSLALDQQKLNKTLEWKFVEPLYIRLSAAEEKLAKGELKRHV